MLLVPLKSRDFRNGVGDWEFLFRMRYREIIHLHQNVASCLFLDETDYKMNWLKLRWIAGGGGTFVTNRELLPYQHLHTPTQALVQLLFKHSVTGVASFDNFTWNVITICSVWWNSAFLTHAAPLLTERQNQFTTCRNRLLIYSHKAKSFSYY